ncbi:hypothetical protein OVS_03420 [Mycoplasma ovis str. Michigan]|uniref:Uncharacterized protein n=1 Tax=Mycoplasma ovis str. Michigan TaxID=1415773 RepID=A0ABM5P1Y4_9MOLU|nr:hypothetical protein OVS_03420 [Mycoplasma ovis str. Michigan]
MSIREIFMEKLLSRNEKTNRNEWIKTWKQ